VRLTINVPGSRPFLGEILIREGWIDQEELTEALVEQRAQGSRKRLGTILMERGRITAAQFMAALSKQLTPVRYFGDRT
jgi:SOS response regulatory protein OraA/RecX